LARRKILQLLPTLIRQSLPLHSRVHMTLTLLRCMRLYIAGSYTLLLIHPNTLLSLSKCFCEVFHDCVISLAWSTLSRYCPSFLPS
jgi:hypothetical protein